MWRFGGQAEFDTGLEHTLNSPEKKAVSEIGGAESGALSAHSLQIDAELAEVVMAWDCLPTAVKAGILAMARAASVAGQQEN
jgi:hypothetical protein